MTVVPQFYGLSAVQGLNYYLQTIVGSINISSSAVPTKNLGLGWTVAKTGTGQYTITLLEPYTKAVAVLATLQAAVAVDLVPQVELVDIVTTNTIVINLNTGGTPTNPAAACVLNFCLFLQTSTVGE